MAEIALALAMGFFSIMVLTMVSMGGGGAAGAKPDLEAGMAVRPSAAPGGGEAATTDTVLIHYAGRFLDAALKPVDPAAFRAEGPLILAVAPNLTFAAVMRARQRTGAIDITVTTLDRRWLAKLKETFK